MNRIPSEAFTLRGVLSLEVTGSLKGRLPQDTNLEGGGGYYLYTYEYSEMLLLLYFVSFIFI